MITRWHQHHPVLFNIVLAVVAIAIVIAIYPTWETALSTTLMVGAVTWFTVWYQRKAAKPLPPGAVVTREQQIWSSRLALWIAPAVLVVFVLLLASLIFL
ncbi:MAG TPA: hypothetical protein VGT61_12175 [Thermomicrobiales bacterium]|jgi:hypothetical protein|nr:hypothetical protein [Thermomicrobiales bacterium]